MSVEEEIVKKGLTAPRVTPLDIEAEIAKEFYLNQIDGVLTICILRLKNGFLVTGESACASPENFNQEIGERVAREKAVEKIWPLLGFRLRDKLFQANTETENYKSHNLQHVGGGVRMCVRCVADETTAHEFPCTSHT